MSIQLSVRHAQLTHLMMVLTHRDAEGNQDKRDDAEDSEHLAAPGLGSPGVDECRECIEQEVLQHHLQHEHFRRLSREGVTESQINVVSFQDIVNEEGDMKI